MQNRDIMMALFHSKKHIESYFHGNSNASIHIIVHRNVYKSNISGIKDTFEGNLQCSED